MKIQLEKTLAQLSEISGWVNIALVREKALQSAKKENPTHTNTPGMSKHFFLHCSSRRSAQAYFSRDSIEYSKSNHKMPDSGNENCTCMLIFHLQN